MTAPKSYAIITVSSFKNSTNLLKTLSKFMFLKSYVIVLSLSPFL